MSDLAARIRERLDDPKQYEENGVGPLVEALLAVVELHELGRGHERVFDKSGNFLMTRPTLESAPTLLVIAENLGIEAGDDG